MLKKCVAVSVISFIALQTHAQSNFDKLLVFGDSLLDSGNLGVRFTNRVGDGNGDFNVGDFAAIAPQLLANELNVSLDTAVTGGTNYAVGGYRTGDILNSIVGTGLALPSGGPIAQPAYLTVNPTISSNALVFIDGGGNDLRDIVSNNPTSAIPDLIRASAQTLVNAIGALNGAGAKYIMVANVPDLGNVPGVRAADIASPGAVAGFSTATAGFNSGFQTLANLGLSGANIIPVDINGFAAFVLDESRAADFGFTTGNIDLGGGLLFDSRYMCFNDVGADCIEHPIYGIDGSAPDPSRLFFNDALHPTAAAGALTGDFLADIIFAPQKVGLLPEMALNASRSQVGITSNELRQSRWKPLQGRLFIAGDISNAEYDTTLSPETETVGLTVGITRAVSNTLLIGAALTVGNQEIDSNGADFEADSFGLTGMLGYRSERIFVDTSVGFSVLNYDDLNRDITLGSQTITASGKTDGYAWVLDGLIGYDLLESETFHLAPAIGVRWINSTVESYQESGGEISNYIWGEQRRKSLQWRYGVVAVMQVSKHVELYAEVFGSQEEEDDLKSIEITNTNLGFSSYELPSYQADGDSIVTATIGASVDISGSSLNLTWNYSDQGDGFEQVLLTYSLPL